MIILRLYFYVLLQGMHNGFTVFQVVSISNDSGYLDIKNRKISCSTLICSCLLLLKIVIESVNLNKTYERKTCYICSFLKKANEQFWLYIYDIISRKLISRWLLRNIIYTFQVFMQYAFLKFLSCFHNCLFYDKCCSLILAETNTLNYTFSIADCL